MKPLKAVMIIQIAALITSVYINFAQYFTIQQMNQNFDNLNQTYNNLNQSYTDLNQRYLALNQTYNQLIDDINHFNNIINQDSAFQTPISKSQAIRIALAYGGWNATSLREQTVGANLRYFAFDADGSVERYLGEVFEPAENYFPVQEGTLTYRYVWLVFISTSGPFPFVHTAYYIDASSGEILSVMESLRD